jgi:ligand-binding sensor domain-containing protein
MNYTVKARSVLLPLLFGCMLITFGRVSAAGGYFANHNQVRQIKYDRSGNALWYATGGGLVRYDLKLGLYRVVSVSNGLPSADITSLALTAGGGILAASAESGVLYRPAGGRWIASGKFDGLPDERVFYVGLSGDNNTATGSSGKKFWAGTGSGARQMVAGPGYIEPEKGSSIILPTATVYDIAENIDGSVFFAVGAGIWRMDNLGAFTHFSSQQGAGPATVTEVESDPSGSGLVLIALGNKIARFDGAGFSVIPGAVVSSSITDLCWAGIDQSGQTVFAVTAGKNIYRLNLTSGLELWASAEDTLLAAGPVVEGGALPVAGSLTSGLLLPDPQGSGYSAVTVPGPLQNILTRVAVDSRGTLWTGSASEAVMRGRAGVSRFDGRQWTHFTEQNSPLLMNMISSVNTAPDGRVYLGTWFGPTVIGSGGFNVLDDGGTADTTDDLWETYTANETALAMGVVRGEIAFDVNGGAWVASRMNQDQSGGLEYFNSSDKAFHSYSNSLTEQNVHTVEVDGAGNVWVGYVTGGLAVIPGGFGGALHDVTAFVSNVGEGTVVDISADPANRIWVATANKLVVINYQETPGDQSRYAYTEMKPEGFAGLAALDVEFESDRAVWIATADGIFRTDLAGNQWRAYNRANSVLATDRVNDLAVDMGRGLLWAATDNGLSALPLAANADRQVSANKLDISPNPWYPDRHGALTVSGIPLYSTVSIVTVSGERVRRWSASSQGGRTFRWDGRTVGGGNGKKCASGVYLILAVAPDGSTFRGKVALVR